MNKRQQQLVYQSLVRHEVMHGKNGKYVRANYKLSKALNKRVRGTEDSVDLLSVILGCALMILGTLIIISAYSQKTYAECKKKGVASLSTLSKQLRDNALVSAHPTTPWIMITKKEKTFLDMTGKLPPESLGKLP